MGNSSNKSSLVVIWGIFGDAFPVLPDCCLKLLLYLIGDSRSSARKIEMKLFSNYNAPITRPYNQHLFQIALHYICYFNILLSINHMNIFWLPCKDYSFIPFPVTLTFTIMSSVRLQYSSRNLWQSCIT